MPPKFDRQPKPMHENAIIEEPLFSNFIFVKNSILDCAPSGWETDVDKEKLPVYRKTLMSLSNNELLEKATDSDIWKNPTHAKAIMDVIDGKTKRP